MDRLPFTEMKDPLLLFGAFGLLVVLLILIGQGWPALLQAALIVVIFAMTAAGYIYLQARATKPVIAEAPEETKPIPRPGQVPFDDETRLQTRRQIDAIKIYNQRRADPDYRELKARYEQLNRVATLLAEAAGVKWWLPSQPDRWKVENEEAADYLLELIDILFSFQDDTGRWDDLAKWSAWGYMLGGARNRWGEAVAFAQRIAWIWYRRDKILEMRQWVEKLSLAAEKGMTTSSDDLLVARLKHAQGRLARLDGHIDEAAEQLRGALTLYRTADAGHGIWETCCDLGQLETNRLNHSEAKHHLDEALRVIERADLKAGRVECQYYFWLLYEYQAVHDAAYRDKAQEAFTQMIQANDSVQTASMEARVRYEMALQELDRGELLNAYLMTRNALKIENTLQTAAWPLVRSKTIQIADLLYAELIRLKQNGSS
jgi:hypothetical protein